jgi:VWFA-related protein
MQVVTIFAGTLLFLGVLTSPFSAAAAEQPAVATFKGQSNLVLVPAVVHDKTCAHIPNLTRADFALAADGEKRAIAVFEEVRPGDDRIRRAQTRPDEFTNMVNGQLQPNRLTVIALDTVTTPELRQTTAREQLLKALAKSIKGDSMVALLLITTSGVRVVQDFTTDPQILVQALRNVVGSEPIARPMTTKTDADQQIPKFDTSKVESPSLKNVQLEIARFYLGELERRAAALERKVAAMNDLDVLEQIAQALSGVPGRKSLIWVGEAFPFTLTGEAVGQNPPDLRSTGGVLQAPPSVNGQQFRMMLPLYERVWKSLNDANVAIYAIDMRGLTTDMVPASEEYMVANERTRQRWLQWDTQDTFRIFADVTGGRAYTNTNDFERAYRESMDDAAAYYLLGYYIDRKKDKVGWHDLNVKVSRMGAEVRARNGFFLRRTEDKSASEKELDVALRSPMDYTGLPLMGRWQGESGSGAKRKVAFTLMLPVGMGLIDETAENHLDLEFFVRAQAPDGTTVAHLGQEMEGRLTNAVAEKAKQEGIRYENTLELPPGRYTVRFVVRDKLSGRIGSVTGTLKVGDGTKSEAQ